MACGEGVCVIDLDPVMPGLVAYDFGDAIRFLTDYLSGDVYFKIHKGGHNLIRARNQFALVRDMERQWERMLGIADAQKRALGL